MLGMYLNPFVSPFQPYYDYLYVTQGNTKEGESFIALMR